jgi:hypothetical protein
MASVLRQPECLELVLVVDTWLAESLDLVEGLPFSEPRFRLIDVNCASQGELSNGIVRTLRGTFIAIADANDIFLAGSIERAVQALVSHPDWLMVCGDREEVSVATGLIQRRLVYSESLWMQVSARNCQASMPAPALVFRRSMAVLLGLLDSSLTTVFDHAFLQSAFASFPRRIGYLPHVQCRTCLHPFRLANRQRSQLALDAMAVIKRQFRSAPATCLYSYALELHLGTVELPEGVSIHEHLSDLATLAAAWLDPESLRQFRQTWHFDLATVPAQLAAEHQAASLQLQQLLPVRLLQAQHPELLLDTPGPPYGPHLRLHQAVQQYSSTYSVFQGASAPAAQLPFTERPFGVNLIGHAFEVFGIGEDIRMAACALQSVGVPCAVIYHPAANGSACIERSLEPLLCADSSGGPYAFNLVCMAAPIHARWLLQAGFDVLRERFNLTAWPWETQQWPKAWFPLLEVADELWPSSTFTAGALHGPAAAAAIPFQVMPMAAAIPDPDRFCNPEARFSARARHDLPTDAVLFGYGFDLNSTAIRKNPIGALEAFQLAFPLPELPASVGREIKSHPLSDQVALMIKTFPPQGDSPEWQWLQLRAAEDPRIHLVAASLERDELLALYGCCDVFLSLHRSEGFGRGMAEALQLGVDVISTAYGGNTEFCSGPLAHPVRFQTVPIPRGAYPCSDGHHWAEPDLEHASALMQHVAARRRGLASDPAKAQLDPSRDPAVLAAYRQRFSYAAAGVRYRVRLEELWSQRYQLASQLKWKANTPL